MKTHYLLLSLTSLFLLSLVLANASPIGICYGRVANNLLPPSEAVNVIKSNGITRTRVFNTDPELLSSFSNTGIELMIGIPNENLPSLAAGTTTSAVEYLQTNIFSLISPTQIKFLVVGNEIFLKDRFYTPHVIPAMQNIYQALQTLGLQNNIKISSAHAATILSNSYPPSAGSFDPNMKSVLIPLLKFLQDTNSPLLVNVYPYFSYVNNKEYVSLDYALFRSPNVERDNNLYYGNLFDATIDAFVYALEREGFGGLEVVVSETGWPTSGGEAASVENAMAYNGNVVRRGLGNVGTPKRPGFGVEVFLFGLFDENEKSGEEFEKHFGIFGVDGVKAYDLNFN